MRLESVRIQRFKCIDDTAEVPLEAGTTCLVGKNESGKTAFLEALYRLNPLPSGLRSGLDDLYDYPRWRRAADRDELDSVVPVEATFELAAEDLAVVADELGDGVLTSPTVRVGRDYAGRLRWQLELDEKGAVRRLAERVHLPKARLRGVTTLAKLRSKLEALGERTASQEELLHRLASFDLATEVGNLLERRMPRFLYFDEYHVLPGRFSIPYLQQTDPEHLSSGERTALAFLGLAGVDADDFLDGEYEARKAALEGAANRLTDEMFEFWSQDPDLRVEFDTDFRPTRRGSGAPLRVDFDREASAEEGRRGREIPPFLEIRIRSARRRLSLNFGEKSNGFVWFFSFLAFFSSFRGGDPPLVLLLDEPGHSLHGSAQGDLLRFIDRRLASHHQVIYTTHSPFMVPPAGPSAVRAVEAGEAGSRVSTDLSEVSAETRLPIVASALFSALPEDFDFATDPEVLARRLAEPKGRKGRR